MTILASSGLDEDETLRGEVLAAQALADTIEGVVLSAVPLLASVSIWCVLRICPPANTFPPRQMRAEDRKSVV